MTTANIKTTYGLKNNIDQFSCPAAAQRYADKCVKLHIVPVLGAVRAKNAPIFD